MRPHIKLTRREIKMKMFELQHSTTVLWVPSHCGIPGNDKADELAKAGSELPQENIPVTHQIMKAKIKSRGWPITHQRAADTYRNKRKPNWKIERKWPKAVRSLFSRLRTGHTPQSALICSLNLLLANLICDFESLFLALF